MTAVYQLWFEWEEKDCELLIGIYSSDSEARAAIERLKGQKGFIDFPNGFHIYPCELNSDSWRQGFFVDEISK